MVGKYPSRARARDADYLVSRHIRHRRLFREGERVDRKPISAISSSRARVRGQHQMKRSAAPEDATADEPQNGKAADAGHIRESWKVVSIVVGGCLAQHFAQTDEPRLPRRIRGPADEMAVALTAAADRSATRDRMSD